ncbi:MAG: porin [bacterium]|nr:porin [bacterium]
MLRPLAIGLLVVGIAPAGLAGGVDFTFGGYVKLDAMYSEYDSGSVPSTSALRDFHLPGAIPVGDGEGDEALDFHAKETRFSFKLGKETARQPLGAYIELDFLLGLNGDERVSNSYNPRLRHAYLTYGDWLFGQTWSTFMIVVLPEDLDFVGVPDGTTFGRQPQVRYTHGPWQFSLENPETTITPNGGGARVEPDDNTLPDVIARYNHSADWGSISGAGIVRQLRLDEAGDATTATGWGISVGGKVKAGERDDFVFQATTGDGLGRHLALNTANSATMDLTGDLEAVPSTAGFVGWRHWYNDRWRSNVNYSAFTADHDVTQSGTDVTRSVGSMSVNLLVSPVPKLTFGVEYIHADRENEADQDGDLDRIQFSAIYKFGFSTPTS